jgi:hypothetical protein
MSQTPSVFISYSHKDEEWKDRLVPHIGVLEKQGHLEIWDDRRITGGDDWFPEIEKAIESAHVAILMISAHFLNSNFILGEEVPRLLERRHKDGLRILPLIVKPCAWKKVEWISPIQARPKDGKAVSSFRGHRLDGVLTTFAEEIFDILDKTPDEPNDNKKIYVPPRKIEISKLPTTSPDVFGREAELEILDNAWEDPHTKIISYIAWGGVGKSALINGWLNKMENDDYKGAELIYAWSFYSQGTKEKGGASADGFISDAFKWFGYSGEIPKSQHDRGRLLAEVISQQKTLLILDGLEPLQHPPGPMHGFLQDNTMGGFLKNLVRNINGLCIITSRCSVENLQTTEGRLSYTQKLENLSDQAGMAVLKSYHLKGKDAEFIKTANEFKGHALALHLVGGYLKAFHNGDIKQRFEIPKLTLEEKNGGHARRVMDSYEKWFAETNKPELDVLHLLGLFDRPAAKEAIDVLVAKPAIPGLTDHLQKLSNHDWHLTLNHLRELRLLAKKDNHNPNALDCHPLIREHFGDILQAQNPKAWKLAHSRLYDYYKNLPDKELPDTLEEMEPLFAAVKHGCLAGDFQEALIDVWWNRTKRGREHYSTKKLGAIGADLSCLAAFFEGLWDKPASGLTEGYKAAALNWAGFSLRAVGRLSEAAQPMKASVENAIQLKDWRNAAIGVGTLSELYLTLGDVASAEKFGEQSVTLADRSGDELKMKDLCSVQATSLHQAGKNDNAEKLFIDAETMQKKLLTRHTYLHSVPGFYYCDLLLSKRKYQGVLERARTTIQYEKEGWYSLLDIALDNLTIGKALMQHTVEGQAPDFAEAGDFINQAVDGLREAGVQDYVARGLFARAILFRHLNEFLNSWGDLDEAREIADYGGMRLHLVDYFLEACRTIKEQVDGDGKPETGKRFPVIENGETLSLTKEEMLNKFKEFFKEAQRLIEETGYHRRDEELEALRVIF